LEVIYGRQNNDFHYNKLTAPRFLYFAIYAAGCRLYLFADLFICTSP
jgi:hypothetical protein